MADGLKAWSDVDGSSRRIRVIEALHYALDELFERMEELNALWQQLLSRCGEL